MPRDLEEGKIGPRRRGATRRVQPPEFYVPIAKQSDFTDIELQMLRLWDDGKIRKAAWSILGLSEKQYKVVAEGIYDKFRLTNRNGRRVPYRAVAMAVVVGIDLSECPSARAQCVKKGVKAQIHSVSSGEK